MKRRGFKVAVIKHDAHGFEMDRPGKDTWRHARAGADVVCIAAPGKMAMISRLEEQLPLRELARRIEGVDIILTEGFKAEALIKIEVLRRAAGLEPVCPPQELTAIVTDGGGYGALPCFSPDDPAAMAGFLTERFLTGQ